jgi:phenylacetate-CoA ligase
LIWNAIRESEAPEKRRSRQLADLKDLASRLYNRVPFYRQRFDSAGVKPSDIQTLADIARVPFTTKDDLRDTYPYGLLAANEDEIVEVHTSSGTTGTPVVDAYTRNDMDIWSEVMARCLMMAGAEKGDVVQNGYGYGLFTGGLGVHYGAHAIGCNTIPIGGGNTERQLQLMRDFKSTILTCTPSYSLFMAEVAGEMGIEMSGLKLKSGIFGAEPWSENMRREIEEKLCLKAYDIYGLTEIIGPGVSNECSEQNGLHVNEDHFYPEIINPETGEVLSDGEKGELVFTTLTKTGTPLLRYRTRDISRLERGECPCGRNLVRMHRILGRTDDMMIIRGVNVFPSQIEQILMEIEETQPHYQIIIDRSETHLDSVELKVEVEPAFFSDETRELERISQKIAAAMKSKLGVSLQIKLVEPKSIERSVGKAKRVIDKRTL